LESSLKLFPSVTFVAVRYLAVWDPFPDQLIAQTGLFLSVQIDNLAATSPLLLSSFQKKEEEEEGRKREQHDSQDASRSLRFYSN